MWSKTKFVIAAALLSGSVSCSALETSAPTARIAETPVEPLVLATELGVPMVEGALEIVRPDPQKVAKTYAHGANAAVVARVEVEPPMPQPELEPEPEWQPSEPESPVVIPARPITPPAIHTAQFVETRNPSFENKELATPVKVALGVGLAGVALGAVAAMAGDGAVEQRALAVTSGSIGVAALATAGVLYALDVGVPKSPVKVTMAPGSVGMHGTF